MKRRNEEEYSSSSSEEIEEEEELSDIEIDQVEFSWKQRNQYITTQLDIMNKLLKMSYDVDDPGFAKKLEIKVQNMYTQIESLLETETMSPMCKDCPEQNVDIVTISDYTDEDVQDIGRKASTLHLKVYGRRPRKMMRYFDGEPTSVNVYSKATAKHTIEKVL